MVESGQSPPRAAVAELGFSNSARVPLGVEVFRYAELTRRISERMRSTVHRTDFHQIFLVTRGSGTMMVDFAEHPCFPGVVLHVSPGRVQRLPDADSPGRALDAVMVLFTPAFPPRLDHAALLLDPFGPVALTASSQDQGAIINAAENLEREYHGAIAGQDLAPLTVELLRHLLGVLLLRLARLSAPGGTTAGDSVDDTAFQRFRHELERSYAATRSASDYAARLGYSPRTLNRACQAVTGRTAKEVIDARVALEAKRLLAHTDLPVAAIAARLGFSEPTNFGKFFTRQDGASPGAFRTAQRGGDGARAH
jgi:AraC-like DNA-binding protein